MKYLVVCDHEKIVVETDNAMKARTFCRCKKCYGIVLKKGKPFYKNIRMYMAPDEPLPRTICRRKQKVLVSEQTDWIDSTVSASPPPQQENQ